MIWKTTNGLGQEVTWYSESWVNKIRDIILNYTECDEGTADETINRIIEVLDGNK